MIGFGQQTYVPDDNFEAILEANGMGNGISNDDYVTTANISSVIELDISDDDISDLTGIEDFISLVELYCENNLITNINLSANLSLKFLECSSNQISTLDISSNINLEELVCTFNLLSSLDLSNNLTLVYLECSNNQINCLDFSLNTVLEELKCDNNLLDQLNTKNGNWVNGVDITAHTNNLTCVEVDNMGYATTNWVSSFDSFVTFNTNCNYTNPCTTTSSIQEQTTNKELFKITDLLGRETKQTNQPLFYIYYDGTVEKRIVIE